jgi:hypothetical protein
VVGYCLLNLDFLLPKRTPDLPAGSQEDNQFACVCIYNLPAFTSGSKRFDLSYSCDVCTSVVLLRTATCSSVIGQVIFLNCPDSRCLFLIAYS